MTKRLRVAATALVAAAVATGCGAPGAGTDAAAGAAGSGQGGGAAGTAAAGGAGTTGTGGADTTGTGGTRGTGTGGAGTTGAGGAGTTGTGGAGTAGTGGAGAAGRGGNDGAAGGGGAGTTGSAGKTGTAGTSGNGGAAGGAAGGQPTGGAAGTTVPPVALDPALLSKCTGTNPIRCTIPVPANGNYNVAVELGSAAAASTSRILAELARLEMQPITLAAGKFSTQTFSVNVRTEVHDDYSAPGKVLDIVVDGSAPALAGLGVAAAPTIPTLFVAGDSTSCDWDPAYVTSHPLERGWAQELSQYLLPGLAVADYADSGDTAGSLYGKFASRGAVMKRGDYLFIQFGHNDQKTQAGIDSFQTNLMKFVNDARAAGATPILFTPVARKTATTANPGFAGLDDQVRQLAASENVALVDLTSLAIAYYRSLTSAQLDATFFSATEGTHFSESGATAIAGIVAKNLKASTVSIRDFLK